MVNYIGQEAKSFLVILEDGSIFFLYTGFLSFCYGWIWLMLAGTAGLNANCFKGHWIHGCYGNKRLCRGLQ